MTIEIKVPDNCKYMDMERQFFKDKLPVTGHYILSKELTGCGATTMYIRDKQDTIILSPRIKLIQNKCQQENNLYPIKKYHEKNGVKTDDPFTQEDVKELVTDIKKHSNDCKANNTTRKFIACYQSLRTIKDALGYEAKKIRIVVDESQSLLNDSELKEGELMDFIELLQWFDTVIYLSATDQTLAFKPVKYLNCIDTYKLIWPNKRSVICKPKQTRSIRESLRYEIIKREKGIYPDAINKDGKLVESKEAVFFVNEVKLIVDTVIALKLDPTDVNILCAETKSNRKKLKTRTTGLKFGSIPIKGEQHKKYTFCTSTVYYGCDFYSYNASTYIFSDANAKNLTVDIILDYPQIIGRQRNSNNPFRDTVNIYYKTMITADDFFSNIQEKTDKSERFMLNPDTEMKLDVARSNSKLKKEDRTNYLYYSKTSMTVQVNYLEIANDKRCFDIYDKVYKDKDSFIMELSESNEVQQVNNKDTMRTLMAFRHSFNTALDYKDKMIAYIDLPDHLKETSFIYNIVPDNYRTAYKVLGKQGIENCNYNCSRIKTEIAKFKETDKLKELIQKSFVLGETYTISTVKQSLQGIYDAYHINKKVTANSITEYCNIVTKKRKINKVDTRCIEIVGYR